ncbi:MAG: WS/DGAT domain-containing protein [Acidobacteriota bacterium]
MKNIPETADASGLEPVHPRDRVWLQDDETNLMVINSIFTLDTIQVEDLRRVWQERVLDARIGEVAPYARFTKTVARRGRRLFWRVDEDFDIKRHIFTLKGEGLGSRQGLQDYIGEEASKPLSFEIPPWQLQLVENFADGQSAVISRTHHVYGDGMGLLPVVLSLMDLDEAGSHQPPKTRGVGGKMWQVATKSALVGGPLLASRALAPADESLFHGPPLSGEKRFAWTPGLDLGEIKAAKNRLAATVNDVLMTAVAGGLRRYAVRRDEDVPESFRVSMPVNVRHPDSPPTMDNRFGAVLVELPVGIADDRKRLLEVKRRMDGLKRSVEPFVYYGSIHVVLSALPAVLGRGLVDFYAQKCSAVMSNVPGPQDPLWLAGRRVRSMLFWVPQRANIGLGISIFSFAGEVRIGLYADAAVVPEPAELIADIEAALEHLMKRA